ncbi:MAG: hypothetical protein ACYSW4_07995 [Planctomycetota bacterium]|jgi:hypothetical protein
MGKARMSTKDETGGSQAGGNKPKVCGCWFVPFNGMVGLRPALVGLDVSEGSLNDTNKGLLRA